MRKVLLLGGKEKARVVSEFVESEYIFHEWRLGGCRHHTAAIQLNEAAAIQPIDNRFVAIFEALQRMSTCSNANGSWDSILTKLDQLHAP